MPPPSLDREKLVEVVRAALHEDVGTGDLTTRSIVGDDDKLSTRVVVREPGVVCGLPVVEEVFAQCDPAIRFEAIGRDGEQVAANASVAQVRGPARGILTGERTALNFFGRLCGIATLTADHAERLRDYPTQVLDTRKTTPLLRFLEK